MSPIFDEEPSILQIPWKECVDTKTIKMKTMPNPAPAVPAD
jgi:hypothetical protein